MVKFVQVTVFGEKMICIVIEIYIYLGSFAILPVDDMQCRSV